MTRLILLVPQLCYLTGLTDKMRDDFHVMKEVGNYTRVTPAQRQLALKKFIDSVAFNQETTGILQSWGLSLAKETVKMKGAVRTFFSQ